MKRILKYEKFVSLKKLWRSTVGSTHQLNVSPEEVDLEENQISLGSKFSLFSYKPKIILVKYLRGPPQFHTPSVQHISSTQKGHSFSAPKILQFHTKNPSVQLNPLSSTPKTHQFNTPPQFHTKNPSVPSPSVPHPKPLSSTPFSSTPKTP